jgi:predicted ATPase/DNA-binding winged helix-turn-helix (wHTH) protein
MAFAYSFGAFELNPERSVLLRDGASVRIGSRAFVLLSALVERAGQVISNEELTARVWADINVSESNLRVHLAAIRKILNGGDKSVESIVTIPGVGYRFVLPVAVQKATIRQRNSSNVPALLAELIGRDAVIEDVLENINRFRFVSIIGSGGIGKTSLALAVSASAISRYDDGACLVDLTPLDNSSSLPIAVASALKLSSSHGSDEAGVVDHLRTRKMLLVFDNCEHLIEAAACLAERLLSQCPDLHLLTTSREPLRAQGEFVRRLLPLQSPPVGDPSLSMAEAMSFPAVQLFLNRAASTHSNFVLREGDAAELAELCAKLDGIPLAIELAAAWVDSFDIKTLVRELDNCLEFLTRGRRTAQERHRTLRATLDWSFRLLTNSEQLLFVRLGVFRSSFKRDAVLAIAVDQLLNAEDVLDGLANLAAKSLVVVTSDEAGPLYRLLDTTRVYANEKLVDLGESDRIRRLHANYFNELIKEMDSQRIPAMPAHHSTYSRIVDELRAAIPWCLSPTGDPALGVEIITSSAYLWSELSLLEDYKRYADQAMMVIRKSPNSAREELRLLNATGPAIYETLGSVPELHKTAVRILELAVHLDDRTVMKGGLLSMWRYHHGRGEYLEALEISEKIREFLESNPSNDLWWIPLKSLSLLYLGRITEARSILAEIDDRIPFPDFDITASYGYNVSVAINGALARILWLLGMPDSASACAEACVNSALAAGNDVGICFGLTLAGCPISLWQRDFHAFDRYFCLLKEHAVRSKSVYWNQYVQVFQIGLSAARAPSASSELLATAHTSRWDYRHWENFSVLGEGFAPEAFVQRALHDRSWWCSAEILRLHALGLRQRASRNEISRVRTLLCSALEIAREQRALSWELRTAKSLLETATSPSEAQEARRLVKGLLGDFTEGFDSEDFSTAEKLVERTSRFAEI